jgi:flagellar basal-body rod protein FlgB
MAIDDIPLLSMLKSRLGYLSQQQRAIAVNVANSDSPGYTPSELKPFSYSVRSAAGATGGVLPLAPVQSGGLSLAGQAVSTSGQTWTTQPAPDSEARMDGNRVVLEEQMMKMSQARGDYETAINIYQKSLSLIQLALKAPGKP